MADQPPTPDPRLDALIGSVLATHGARLDDEQREAVRRHAERLRTSAALLEGYHLENGDEPDASFQAIDKVDAV